MEELWADKINSNNNSNGNNSVNSNSSNKPRLQPQPFSRARKCATLQTLRAPQDPVPPSGQPNAPRSTSHGRMFAPNMWKPKTTDPPEANVNKTDNVHRTSQNQPRTFDPGFFLLKLLTASPISHTLLDKWRSRIPLVNLNSWY